MSIFGFFKKKKGVVSDDDKDSKVKAANASLNDDKNEDDDEDDDEESKKAKIKQYEDKVKGKRESPDDVDFDAMLSQIDTSKLPFKQKMALSVLKKMPRSKQKQIFEEARKFMSNPKEIQDHKKEIEEQIEKMVEDGQIDKSQIAAVKSRFGLR